MQHVVIDLHKRYRVVSALNEQGQRTREGRIDGNSAAGFAQFFKSLGEPSQVVMEATWNWGRVHDLLESIELLLPASREYFWRRGTRTRVRMNQSPFYFLTLPCL